MRCIEMQGTGKNTVRVDGLIETWDVLKFTFSGFSPEWKFWLIETWDVLK